MATSKPRPNPEHLPKEATVKWVPISLMRVSMAAQRDRRQARVDYLVANLNLDELGTPTVNHRDGLFFIIDGQHRVEALRETGWDNQMIECQVYEDLTEQQEADKFLRQNDQLNHTSMAKFKIAVTAEWPEQTEVDKIVRHAGCKVTFDKVDGGISAVGTLMRVYRRSDGETLARTLNLIMATYGDEGLDADIIDGFSYVCARYGALVDDETAVKRLSGMRGGLDALRKSANRARDAYGIGKGQATAVAVVEALNSTRGGPKLPSWFRN